MEFGDNLHEMSNPVFRKKYITNLFSAEYAKGVVKVNLLDQQKFALMIKIKKEIAYST